MNVIGSVGDAGGGNGGGGRQRKGVPRGRRSPRVKEEPGKEIAAAREESKRDLNGERGVRVGKEKGRRDEKAREKQRGIPRAPSTQGGSSLRRVGMGLSSHPVPSSLCSDQQGVRSARMGWQCGGCWVANRFSAISPRLPPK